MSNNLERAGKRRKEGGCWRDGASIEYRRVRRGDRLKLKQYLRQRQKRQRP